MTTKPLQILGLCLIATSLVACGGNSPTPAKTLTSAVYVMGDSLADVGTFGYKYTVQDAGNPKGFPVWPQIVASAVGLDGGLQCHAYVGTDEDTISVNPVAGCTNYAIGGGRIIVPGKAANPRNINNQFVLKANGGNYRSTDLVLIDIGANDAADLTGAYLGASKDAAGLATYKGFLLLQLEEATRDALLAQPNGGALAAGAYMQKLADTFYAQLKAQVLDKGAAKVVVLNIPDITLTPRFKAVLGGVKAAAEQAAPNTGQATANALQAAIQQWIGAFNSRLASHIGADARVALVDFYADFSDEVNSPANYQLTNVQTPACPVARLDANGLPDYDFPSCTSTALDASAGKSPGWWKSYGFADGFHPTPYSHQLLAASVARAMGRAGWL